MKDIGLMRKFSHRYKEAGKSTIPVHNGNLQSDQMGRLLASKPEIRKRQESGSFTEYLKISLQINFIAGVT